MDRGRVAMARGAATDSEMDARPDEEEPGLAERAQRAQRAQRGVGAETKNKKEKRPFQLLAFPGRREEGGEREEVGVEEGNAGEAGEAGEAEAGAGAPIALAERTAALRRAMAEMQGRWGPGAVRMGAEVAPRRRKEGDTRVRARELPAWWPQPGVRARPHSLELVGDRHGAPLGLALAWVAAARPALVAVVEEPGAIRFHVDAAAGAGIPLERLIIVRPPGGERESRVALDAAVVLLRSEAFDVVVCPLPVGEGTFISTSFANKLATLASKAGTTLLLLTGQRGRSLGAAAEFRVRALGRRWVWEHGELAGMTLRVVTERARAAGGAELGGAGELTEHEITLRMHRRARYGPATAINATGIGFASEGAAADVGDGAAGAAGAAGGADRVRVAAAVRLAGGERARPAEERDRDGDRGREAVAVSVAQ